MEEIYQTYKDDAEFFLVYIKEAHPSDGWQVPMNERQGVVYEDPENSEERSEVASECVESLELTMPTLIDDMEDTTNKAYNASPDRIYVVGLDGKISYRGAMGPRGFSVDELEKHLGKLFHEK